MDSSQSKEELVIAQTGYISGDTTSSLKKGYNIMEVLGIVVACLILVAIMVYIQGARVKVQEIQGCDR